MKKVRDTGFSQKKSGNAGSGPPPPPHPPLPLQTLQDVCFPILARLPGLHQDLESMASDRAQWNYTVVQIFGVPCLCGTVGAGQRRVPGTSLAFACIKKVNAPLKPEWCGGSWGGGCGDFKWLVHYIDSQSTETLHSSHSFTLIFLSPPVANL